MSKYLRYAGIAASAILIVFGIAIDRRRRHRPTTPSATNLVRGADRRLARHDAQGHQGRMSPAAGLKNVVLPTCSVAGAVDRQWYGNARCFAQYMRVHALEATGGQVYAEMGQYLDGGRQGRPSDKAAAAIDRERKQPKVWNGARNIWVNETALSTALNTSYFAENVALFSVVMGVALLLTGIGFLVVTLNLLRPVARKEETAAGRPSGGVPAAVS